MSEIRIDRITAQIGAEISGIDLRDPLDDESVATIQKALNNHLVLVFRDQDITPDQQVVFARRFGEISPPPITPRYGDSPD